MSTMTREGTERRHGTRPSPRHAGGARGAAAVAVAAPELEPRRETRPNHLRVVRTTERVRSRPRLRPGLAMVLTASLFLTLFAVAGAHTLLVQGQVQLDQVDAELATEQARYQVLREQVAELESPDRIVAAAHEQGMVTPDDLVYLQPRALDRSAVGPTTGDDSEPVDDPTAGGAPDQGWPAMKPLLEATAP